MAGAGREYIVEFHEESGGAAKREEIVRCRDCEHFRIGPNWDGCAFSERYAKPDGFCAWGERKGE